MHHTFSQDSRSGEPTTSEASGATVRREPVPPAVAVEHLTKRYGPTVAVDDLSFAIRPGTISGFLGPNGAGKTTTFRMLVGLATPSSGNARVFGRPYASLKDPIRRVGALLEVSGYHPSRTGRNHLRLLARTAGIPDTRADELLALVGLEYAGDRAVGGYSSGMRQRLGLAAALLGDPELLLLDEPANGLDPKGMRWLREFLRGLAHDQGKTVFVSSHVLAEVAQLVDEVVIINKGRLVTQDSIDSVTTHVGATVAVRSPEVARLADVLAERGAAVAVNGHNRLLVSGIRIEDVGRLAAAHDVVLYGLSEEGLSLEETFLALTTPEAQP